MEKSFIPHTSNFTFFAHINYCAQIIFHIFFNTPNQEKDINN